MLRLMGSIVKLVLFVGVVLVVGNQLEWKGQTVSDQIKTSMAHAEPSTWLQTGIKTIKKWADSLQHDAQNAQEHLSNTDRQMLNDLIKD